MMKITGDTLLDTHPFVIPLNSCAVPYPPPRRLSTDAMKFAFAFNMNT